MNVSAAPAPAWPGTAADPTPGTAADPTPGTAADPTPGTAADPTPGTPADPRLDPGADPRERAAAENFPVALRLLPAAHRAGLLAVYRYARAVDELGDTLAPDQRLAALDDVATQVARLRDGRPLTAPGAAFVAGLAPWVARGLATGPLLDLVEANRVDQVTTRYQTWEQLLGYCRLSANPVGRLVLSLFDADSAPHASASDAVCTALQVLEHLQDLAEDHRAGRVYLPAEEMGRHGVTEADLAAATATPALRGLTAELTGRCRGLLRAAGPLVRSLRGPARLAVAGFAGGGLAVADALERAGYDTLAAPVRPGRVDTARHALALAAPRPWPARSATW